MSLKIWAASMRSLATRFRAAIATPAASHRLIVTLGHADDRLAAMMAGVVMFSTRIFADPFPRLPTNAERAAWDADANALRLALERRGHLPPMVNSAGDLLAVSVPPSFARRVMTLRPHPAFRDASLAALSLLLHCPDELRRSSIGDILPWPNAVDQLTTAGDVSDDDVREHVRAQRDFGRGFVGVLNRGLIFTRRIDATPETDEDAWPTFLHRVAWAAPVGLGYLATRWKWLDNARVTIDGANAHVDGDFPAGTGTSAERWATMRAAVLATDADYSDLGDGRRLDVADASACACEWLAGYAESLADAPPTIAKDATPPNTPVTIGPTLTTAQKIDLAIGHLRRDPDLSDRAIATLVGVSQGTLSKSPTWRSARAASVVAPPPLGRRFTNGRIEADD